VNTMNGNLSEGKPVLFMPAHDMGDPLKGRELVTYDGKAKIAFCVPVSWDQWCNTNTLNFIMEQVRKPFFYRFVPLASRSPEIGRNKIIAELMNKDPNWTHIMFLDWDTYPLADGVLDAMERLLAVDKDIVAGIYPVWLQNLPFWTCVTEEPEDTGKSELLGHLCLEPFPFREPTKVARVGMGFSLIKRRVFEKVDQPYMKQLYREDGSIRTTEDYYFCDKARREGCEVWIDPRIVCSHSQRRDTTMDIVTTSKYVSDAKNEEFQKLMSEAKAQGGDGEFQDSAA
jgi:hypothetical protein